MSTLDTAAAIRHLALDLLARREHGYSELARKLHQRGVASELSEPVLARLAEEGLLSDRRYLESMVRKRLNAGYGPLRIRDELVHLGLSRQAVEQYFAEQVIDWSAQLRAVWQRKFACRLPQDQRERGKQARFLAYRGFSAEMISQLWRS